MVNMICGFFQDVQKLVSGALKRICAMIVLVLILAGVAYLCIVCAINLS